MKKDVIKPGLVVSSQALEGNPLRHSETLAQLAQAAEFGGAVAIRANGCADIKAMKERLTVPILGLNKIKDATGTVIITPSFERAKEVADLGADVIALDATFRTSDIKEDVGELIARIHNELDLPVMADISTPEEALRAEQLGADYISTTLAGYLADRPYAPEDKYEPDFAVLKSILQSGVKVPVIAEGRFWTAKDVAQAMRMGCHAVVIGKAITNAMASTEYFVKAAKAGIAERENPVSTESINDYTKDIDTLSTYELLRKINREDESVAARVKESLPMVTAALDGVYKNFRDGGRILYCGAGTSGRLSVADAAECAPTYGVSNDRVIATVAGGKEAVFNAAENKEDGFADGYEAAKALQMTDKDTAFAISANGNAQFCLGFMAYAKEQGAKTIALTNNLSTKMAAACDYPIEVLTGAEVVKGSTRMKAGTAQKMVLNMFSTALFVKSGCVIGNLMVNIQPNNVKLKRRAVSMLQTLTGNSEAECEKALIENDWSIRSVLEKGEQV